MTEPDRKTLSANQARDLFEYSIVSGRLYWRVSRGPIKAGNRAGTPSDDGSLQVGVDYKRYKAHRLAVLIVTGEWPTYDVDHRDGSPSNNAWLNLRDVTHVVNQQNRRRAHSNNKSKLLGVSFHKGDQKWRASIRVNGRAKHVGNFSTPELAHAAYVEAKRKLHPGCTL